MMGGWRQFFFAIILVSGFPFVSPAEEASSGIDPSLVIEQFDVFNDGDLLLVPVRVFGKSRLFVVDTGCTLMVYDERLRPQMGETLRTIKASTTTGEMSVDLFNAPAATLGRLDLRAEERVACLDFSELRQQTGHDIEGIIGMPFIQKYIIHLDFEAGRLLLLSDVPENAGNPSYLIYDEGLPTMRWRMKDTYGHFFALDTGFMGSVSCGSELFEFLAGRKTIVAVTDGEILGASGRAVVREGCLVGMSLDEFHVSNVPIHSKPPNNQGNSLGMDVLTRFTVTFDFPNMVAYLKPNRNSQRPFQDYIGGTGFIRKSGDTIVESLRSDGPAARAGIQKGDHLLEIDELDATTKRLFTLRQKLSIPGTTVRVKLKRGDEVVDVELKLPGEKEESVREVVGR